MSDEKKGEGSPSQLDPSKGGKARAAKLSPEERQDIARKAAEARWAANSLPKATHSSEDHPLVIGGIEIPCYVLENETRVISHRGLQRSIGMAQSGGAQRMANLVAGFEAKGLDCKDLRARIETPIEFVATGPGRTFGFEATVLADLCETIVEAKRAGILQKQQLKYAAPAEILLRGFAHVGIIALVDEATGYQYVRARKSLEEILEQFISKDLLRWAKMFPDDFYEEMFRLKGWKYDPKSNKRPVFAGKLTTDLVYDRLAPGVLEELKRITPRDDKGRLKHKYHQRLTEDVGHPRLREHLWAVIALMRSADDWRTFYRAMNRALPPQVKMPLFDTDWNATVEGEACEEAVTSSTLPPPPS